MYSLLYLCTLLNLFYPANSVLRKVAFRICGEKKRFAPPESSKNALPLPLKLSKNFVTLPGYW